MEYAGGFWQKFEYDERGNRISYNDSTGFWEKEKYDERGNPTYWENSDGYRWGTPRPVEIKADDLEQSM